MSTLLFIGYGIVVVLFVRPLTGHFAWSLYEGYCGLYPALSEGTSGPLGMHWFFGLVLGAACAAIWPVAVLFVVVGARFPAIGAERNARTRAQDRRIRELEEELRVVR